MMRWSTAGESHGPALIALFEGMPAGVHVSSSDVESALARRRHGYGRGTRQKFEQDSLQILSGVRHGVTLGSPIALQIGNSEWPKWQTVMSADPVDPSDLLIDAGTGDEREVARNKKLTKPRPGHADLIGMNKYGFDDARNVLERASARETAARVALGCLASRYLAQVADIGIVSHVVQIGSQKAERGEYVPQLGDREALDQSDVRTLNPDLATKFRREIDEAQAAGDTLGGVVEVIAYGVPQALGTYCVDEQRLDAQIAAAMMSIQSVKGVEIGDGFESAGRRGSCAHDEITRGETRLLRLSNRAGGIEGGMSNGEPIVVRVALKPISTVPHALRTIDTCTGEATRALHQRSDTTAVVPAATIAEAMLALVLAQALNDKFGGDSVTETQRNLSAWQAAIPEVRR
ncbi:chorismate synthase [Arcanobacterium pluranimalium]|uniref:chorismate synthase n=1 Tax=Arcanobacterium pluranimalium TaxID=108028 RepID=UPI001958FB60|nr:chorismate synthase [Arcanobacterium pluranimalium]MBM7825441.1 chorismate synthase [Arcanobacterium pluranimalium]